jgi:type II secretory pathway component PulF
MESGVSMQKAFANEKIFKSALFYLETASVNGAGSKSFSLIAQQIEKTKTVREQIFLKIAEPAMLLAAGIYMLILLKNTVMPLMMNYGGLL